jgi:Tfp pilus assembly protein PilF
MKDKKWGLILCLAILCLSLALAGQEGRGSGRVRGTVKDEAGQPVEEAKIVAESLEFKTTFEATSDKDGRWALAGLGTGFFRITISKEGFATNYHEMQVSQFSRNNPPVDFILKKIQSVAPGMPAVQDPSTLAVLEEGNQLYDQQKYAEAAAKFEEFLFKNPAIYQVYFNIGNCLREMGEYEKAVVAYDKFLEKIKEEKGSFQGSEAAAKALSGLGETYVKQGDLAKANEYFKLAVDYFPQDEALAFNVGEIYFKQGETDKAIEYFKLAVGIKKDWPIAHLKLGYAYLNKGEYKLAVESMKKFLELAPDDPQAPTIQNLIPELEKLIKN